LVCTAARVGRIMKQFFLHTLTGTFGIAFYGLYGGLIVGGFYWLWMAARFGSVLMFVIGIVPPAFVVTAPVGLYSLIFGPPHWVSSYFGHVPRGWSEETTSTYIKTCDANMVQQGVPLDKGETFCRCTIDKV
jgi:hypothetical protein